MSDKQVYIENFKNHVDQEVIVKGWLYNKRGAGKKLLFLLVRDGTGVVQGVTEKKVIGAEVFKECKNLSQESSLIVKGTVKEEPRAPGGYEMHVKEVQIVAQAQEYPISPKEHGADFLLQHRHLWLRSSKQHALLRVRSRIIKSIRDFFDERGFIMVDAPIFTPNACEGTTTLFDVDYFGEKAFLTQSGQLYMEAAAMAFGKVYCFGPTFRAEKSKTRRHLIEFWMMEPEIAYATLDDVMECEENLISYVVEKVLASNQEDLKTLERDTSTLEKIKPPFPRISYDEALELLKKEGQEIPWGEDFGAPHETAISKHFDKPVLIHRYPTKCKAFYMERDPKDEKYSLSVDMIAPEGYGEIIGGGQRMDSLELLEQQIKEHKLPQEAFAWYTDLRRYGTVPHGGFGLGLERTVAWICGRAHIRETIPFPRMLERMYP